MLEVVGKRPTSGQRHPKTSQRRSVSLDSVAELYLRETCGKVLLSGEAGMGKTVLSLKLLADIAHRRKTDPALLYGGTVQPVPVIFNLPTWPSQLELQDWLAGNLAERFRLKQTVAARLVSDGYVLPILDSLDEVDSEARPSDKTATIVAAVNRYSATRVGARLILTCRSDSTIYHRVRKQIRGFDELRVHPLRYIDVRDYLESQCGEDNASEWKIVLDAAADSTSPVRGVLGTPWRLAMSATYLRGGGSAEDFLPTRDERRSRKAMTIPAAYLNRVEGLLYETFISARSRHHGKQPIRVTLHLMQIAKLLEEGKRRSVAAPTELLLHEWWRLLDRRKVSLYQALLVFTLINLSFSAFRFFEFSENDKPESPVIYALAFFSNFILLALLAGRAAGVRTSPLRVSLRSLRTSRGGVLVAASAAIAVLAGGTAYISTGPSYGISIGAAIALTGTIGATLAPWDHLTVESPLAILRKDFLASALFGVAIGGFVGIYTTELLGKPVGVALGLGYVFAAIASSIMAKYLIAVYISAGVGAPWRLARFLSWGCRAGLLRVSGVGYQFRHKGLQQYLLDLQRSTFPDGTDAR
ncbi:NACHT domain-containing protein [Micromonospora sp. NPDC050397]|uniref:NACHT domain-containing protein n=1 Tax=Micromonospora sp. NPDC050397 TaxID=3364279 RepID=UPI00384B606D